MPSEGTFLFFFGRGRNLSGTPALITIISPGVCHVSVHVRHARHRHRARLCACTKCTFRPLSLKASAKVFIGAPISRQRVLFKGPRVAAESRAGVGGSMTGLSRAKTRLRRVKSTGGGL